MLVTEGVGETHLKYCKREALVRKLPNRPRKSLFERVHKQV